MNVDASIEKLADQILSGSERALSRALTLVERGGEVAGQLVDLLHRHTGRAHVVGITGSPGSGKSTLVRALIRAARQKGLTVGVIAFDPSSPFSGGSILGDRIRMNDASLEPGVFIRSLATRGMLGGLSRAAADSIALMDAAGKELIFVETVGVGQGEVEVMQAVHTVVVVSVPGLGDEIQTLKAGVLEIADIHVVNKADREGADRTWAELRSMLILNGPNRFAWQPPVIRCVALREEGIAELLNSVSEHFKALRACDDYDQRRKRMTKARVLSIAHELLTDDTNQQRFDSEDLMERVLRLELGPHAAGRQLLMGSGHRQQGRRSQND